MRDQFNVRPVWSDGMILGEGPVYSIRERVIYWVDIKKPSLYRLDLATEQIRSYAMPDYIGWIIERAGGGLVAGLRHGVALLSLDPLHIDYIARVETNRPTYRLNDAKAHPNGSIYFGTMDNEEKESGGCLYRLFPDGQMTQLDSGYRVTNGPAFSRDGRRMYTPDSARGVVYCFDVRDDGSLAGKREFVRLAAEDGYPDGMTVDADDHLWIAHWGGACVKRFTPHGQVERVISLPAPNITSCAFGGPDLDRLFVTSATIGLSDQQRGAYPLAGSLFEVDTGCVGVAPALFGA